MFEFSRRHVMKCARDDLALSEWRSREAVVDVRNG
jgi:hypothetical protein